MTMHTEHDSIHTHGLADNCPRCEEMAENPVFTLDSANLESLVRRTKRWRNESDPNWDNCRPRSQNELRAMQKIDHHLSIIYRIQEYL